jgi:hypothetical protein
MAASEKRHRTQRHRVQYRAAPDGAAGRSGAFETIDQLLLLEPPVLSSTDVSEYGGRQQMMIEDGAGPRQD